jgi:NTP pyrophosphatase (non-canonical NTP hydrolase)
MRKRTMPLATALKQPPGRRTQLQLAFSSQNSVMEVERAVAAPVLTDVRRISAHPTRCNVVLCGSFRRDPPRLRETFEQLHAAGCAVLSPGNVDIEAQVDGFVFMRGETFFTPESIEQRHLRAIDAAEFVWLHAPEGYVGLSGSMEIGYARAAGIPIFSSDPISDPTLAQFVRTVASPADVVRAVATGAVTPPGSMRAFQHYYRRAAIRRGYAGEGALECVLLMLEEVGELARAVRKERALARHHGASHSSIAEELADVFLYVIHMANTLDIDLEEVVRAKDLRNEHRFIARMLKDGER